MVCGGPSEGGGQPSSCRLLSREKGRTADGPAAAVAVDRAREALARPLDVLLLGAAVVARVERLRVARRGVGREEDDVRLEEEDGLRGGEETTSAESFSARARGGEGGGGGGRTLMPRSERNVSQVAHRTLYTRWIEGGGAWCCCGGWAWRCGGANEAAGGARYDCWTWRRWKYSCWRCAHWSDDCCCCRGASRGAPGAESMRESEPAPRGTASSGSRTSRWTGRRDDEATGWS